MGAMPLENHPGWGWGAGEGNAGQYMGCRVSGIRPDSPRETGLRIKGTAGGSRFEKTAVFVLGRKQIGVSEQQALGRESRRTQKGGS